jgi:hypothetical protein
MMSGARQVSGSKLADVGHRHVLMLGRVRDQLRDVRVGVTTSLSKPPMTGPLRGLKRTH